MDLLTQLDRAQEALDAAFSNDQHGDYLALCRCLGTANEAMAEAAMIAVQKAFDEGATKKALAAALNVPASTFRGMEKSRPRVGDGLDPLRAMLP